MLLLLCFTLTANVSAVVYNIGVKSGDWIKYNISITSGPYTVQGWIKITIKSVSGTQIGGTFETGIAGQPTTNQTFSLDISTGSGTIGGFIIPSNLTVGQSIPGEAATVQSEVDWHGRKAVYANATSPYVGMKGQLYWDKATGVLLEATSSMGETSFTISAAETNLWGGGLFGGFGGLEWWVWVIIIVVIVGGVAAVFIISRRRKPPTPLISPQAQPPPPPPPPPT